MDFLPGSSKMKKSTGTYLFKSLRLKKILLNIQHIRIQCLTLFHIFVGLLIFTSRLSSAPTAPLSNPFDPVAKSLVTLAICLLLFR